MKILRYDVIFVENTGPGKRRTHYVPKNDVATLDDVATVDGVDFQISKQVNRSIQRC